MTVNSSLVAGTEVHRDRQQFKSFCSFLGLFAPVHAQEAQIRSTAHRVTVLPAALLLLEQYYTSSSCYRKNHDPQIRSTKEDRPKNIS